jgi:ZIP family zinc transporter
MVRIALLVRLAAAAALLFLPPVAAFADADEMQMPAGVLPSQVGLQPLRGAIPSPTPYPGESRVLRRPDGAYDAVPDVRGNVKHYVIVERNAPWTLKPGLTVMAKTYNGVVPGPAIDVREGDRVVIDYRNELDVPDTIHLHGIHGITTAVDGVTGWGQAPVPKHGTYRYAFTATQPGTFMYHTHDRRATLNSGLYGAIVVHEAHPSADVRADRDYLVFLSSWNVQSTGESEFTLNGKEYPLTTPLEVRSGDRVRLRYVNMSAENLHTMHVHGHTQVLVQKDAWPVRPQRVDTVPLGPAERADVIVVANAAPGTWMLQCHVLDHVEDADGMPSGLVTALHYAGTPNKFSAMAAAMRDMAVPPSEPRGQGRLSFLATLGLGTFAGLTIFLGLPVARARRLSPNVIALLNALAIGILVYLLIEIAQGALRPLTAGMTVWRGGAAFPAGAAVALAGGLLLGLGGLTYASSSLAKRGKAVADRPWTLALMVAAGIGAHNFAEGLAIGASAASGATVVAFGLIVGFALHNATEGFGVAAPLAGREVPSWPRLAMAGLIAGGPTTLGTMVGYAASAPLLGQFFLAIAVGALFYVIGELWSVLKKLGMVNVAAASMVSAGFLIALATEMIVDFSSPA